jgi:hypothetical protein
MPENDLHPELTHALLTRHAPCREDACDCVGLTHETPPSSSSSGAQVVLVVGSDDGEVKGAWGEAGGGGGWGATQAA